MILPSLDGRGLREGEDLTPSLTLPHPGGGNIVPKL